MLKIVPRPLFSDFQAVNVHGVVFGAVSGPIYCFPAENRCFTGVQMCGGGIFRPFYGHSPVLINDQIINAVIRTVFVQLVEDDRAAVAVGYRLRIFDRAFF